MMDALRAVACAIRRPAKPACVPAIAYVDLASASPAHQADVMNPNRVTESSVRLVSNAFVMSAYLQRAVYAMTGTTNLAKTMPHAIPVISAGLS